MKLLFRQPLARSLQTQAVSKPNVLCCSPLLPQEVALQQQIIRPTGSFPQARRAQNCRLHVARGGAIL